MSSALDRPIAITFFKNYAATEKHEEPYTPRALAERIRTITKARKQNLPWLKLATFGDKRTDKNCLRNDENVKAITGIEADYDGEKVSFEEAEEQLTKVGVAAILYTSPTHAEDAPRWRVLCPLSDDMPAPAREKMVGRLNGLFGGIFSGESFTLSQAYYFGSIRHSPSHRVELIDGTPIDKHDDLDEIWRGRPHTETTPNGSVSPTSGPVDRDALLREMMAGTNYHQNKVRLAGHFARNNIAFMDARAALIDAMEAIPDVDRDQRWRSRRADIDRVMEDIYGKEAKQRDAREAPLPGEREPNESRKAAPADHECSLAELEGRVFPPIMWAVPDYIPEGLTVFAGRPKIGKSWWMLNVALGIARGKEALGKSLDKGDVLYCGLEDGERRMQSRVAKLLGPDFKGWPANFTFRHRLDALDAGGLDYLEGWLIAHPHRRLVVIDTLGRVRGMKNPREEQYQYDYRLIGSLQELATRYRVAIVVVHHVRKSDAEDVLDTVSGTTGIAGAADTVMVLIRTDKGVRLYMRGRDCEEQDKLVEFDPETASWEVVGDFDEADPGGGLQGLRKRVYDLLAASAVAMTPVQIAARLNEPRSKVKQTLWRMSQADPAQVAKNADTFGAYEARAPKET